MGLTVVDVSVVGVPIALVDKDPGSIRFLFRSWSPSATRLTPTPSEMLTRLLVEHALHIQRRGWETRGRVHDGRIGHPAFKNTAAGAVVF